MSRDHARGALFVIAAPSGAGKTTLVRALLGRLPEVRFSISYTTREPRPRERHGADYFFVKPAEFERMVKAGEFLEHARVFDSAGLAAHRLNACGYSLGSTFAPNWMDWPMIYADNPVVLAPGMVFFLHMILFDSEAGIPASIGRTSLVTETGAEALSAAALELTVK